MQRSWKIGYKDIEKIVASLKRQRERGRPKSDLETKGIYINLPVDLLALIKLKAKKLNIGYQSYIKMILTKQLDWLM